MDFIITVAHEKSYLALLHVLLFYSLCENWFGRTFLFTTQNKMLGAVRVQCDIPALEGDLKYTHAHRVILQAAFQNINDGAWAIALRTLEEIPRFLSESH